MSLGIRGMGAAGRFKRSSRVDVLVIGLAAVICWTGPGCTVGLPLAGNSNEGTTEPNTEHDDGNDAGADENGNGGDQSGGAPVASDGDEITPLTVTEVDHILGSADAPVTVIEYLDFQCGACQGFALNTFPDIQRTYIDAGDVRWVSRHFPLVAIHEFAEPAAQASECAAEQGSFYAYHDLLFDRQPEFTREDLVAYAGELGLQINQFTSCLDSEVMGQEVAADALSGLAMGVRGTPTFFINGQGYFGSFNVSDFSDMIETALADTADSGDSPFGDNLFP